jgi:small GTP-binding protein
LFALWTKKKKKLIGSFLMSKDKLKIMFIGASGAGKSVLMNRLRKGLFEEVQSTIGLDFLTLKLTLDNGSDVNLMIFDTCGQVKFMDIVETYYRAMEAAIFFFDPTSLDSLKFMEVWKKHFDSHTENKLPCFIASPKRDLKPSTDIKIDDEYCKKKGFLGYTKFSNIE